MGVLRARGSAEALRSSKASKSVVKRRRQERNCGENEKIIMSGARVVSSMQFFFLQRVPVWLSRGPVCVYEQ